MATTVDLKNVVKNLVDGTLDENLCRVCLLPFEDVYENIYTKICKEEKQFCIADVLQQVCGIELTERDNYNVCSECFIAASSVYKFYLLTKRSTEILNYYVDMITKNIDTFEITEDVSTDSLCITLPEIITETAAFDYEVKCPSKYISEADNIENDIIVRNLHDLMIPNKKIKLEDDELMIINIKENKEPVIYPLDIKIEGKRLDLERVMPVKRNVNNHQDLMLHRDKTQKIRRKRNKMVYKVCSKCPAKYMFISKLKYHMKKEHGVDLYVCKICKMMLESEESFKAHLKTHNNVYHCDKCDLIFKRYDSLFSHLRLHDDTDNAVRQEAAHICELCGIVLMNEEDLTDHYDKKHDKKYTCYYCGRMYKGEKGFEMHVKKHEMHLKAKKQTSEKSSADNTESIPNKSKKLMCSSCGRHFVDERGLKWHIMVHNNDRPHTCDVCGRGFVSANRLNQHTVCAHTVPTRRCPLCPALFHLRSMVNTHIKKVHLKTHKRRNRTSKHQNVPWKTEAVPIQELSVSIQNEILELQTRTKSPVPQAKDVVLLSPDWDWKKNNQNVE